MEYKRKDLKYYVMIAWYVLWIGLYMGGGIGLSFINPVGGVLLWLLGIGLSLEYYLVYAPKYGGVVK